MLRAIADNIWEVNGQVKVMPAMYLPCRMTVVRLEDGRLWLHSPVTLDDETCSDIERFGEVAYLVAPNTWHHLFLEDAQRRFPDALTWGAPGLPDKRGDLRFDGVFGREYEGWGEEIERLSIEGEADISESVFFHWPSHTLICTDLLFNLHEFEGWLTPWFCRVVGTHKRFAHSKLWKTKYEDIDVFARSVRKMCEWPIERVVMAHGEIVDSRCQERLEEAFEWLYSKVSTAENPQSVA